MPWASLMGRGRLPTAECVSVTSADAALLWDAVDAWSRARPALLGASVCMMGAGAVAALLGVLASLAVHGTLQQVSPSLGPVLPASPPGHIPLVLVLADLAVQSCLAALGLLIGWAVGRQGGLGGRGPRRPG